MPVHVLYATKVTATVVEMGMSPRTMAASI